MTRARHLGRDQAEQAVAKLKAFSQPQRLMILTLLLGGEFSVGEIDEATGIGQPALSQQLAELRRAELVQTRRQGTQIHYSLANNDVALCIRCLDIILGDQDGRAEQLAGLLTSEPFAAGKQPQRGVARFARIL